MAKGKQYEEAKKQVLELKAFYTHLAIYLVVALLLFVVDYSDAGNWWFYWPVIGWGIFVVAQGISVAKFGVGWEEKKIKELMDKKK
jgi:fatty acid desaturase